MSNPVNVSFLKKYNPLKISLAGLFFWLIIFFLIPLRVKLQIGFMPFVYLIANYIFFFLGLKIISQTKPEKELTYTVNKRILWKILYIVILIAVIGFFFKVLDKFYIRGASFQNSISYNRILLEKSGVSVISIISAITNAFCFLPLFIYYMIQPKKKWLFLLCMFLFFSAGFEFIMLGSRSGLFVIIILFTTYLFYFKKVKIKPIKFLIILGILSVLGIFSTQLFIERTKDFAKTDKVAIEHILKRSNYNFTITPKEETKVKIIKSSNKTIQAARLTAINFAQYYLHGVFEFGYLYNNYKKNHYYGAYTFNILVKFINTIFRTNFDIKEIQNAPTRTGIYTTFFGPIFIDFGWFSLIFMFFFGVFQKLLFNKTMAGRFQFIPLLFYMLIINFFMPVFNFINGAQGIYTICSFVAFGLIYILLTGKLKISKGNGKTQYVRILK
tara:strand:- start:790 stop:2115 length:1326 start_codon:yes stop_codon:yes gene_type:complete